MNVTLEQPAGQPGAVAARLTITGEAVAYIVIVVAAALLRLIDLGAMPLSDAEAYHALAALRAVNPTVPGPALPPASPALFAGQALTMGMLGGSEATARLFVALAGVGLALAPALWRAQLGRLPALLFSALLALSPTAVAAARTTDGATLSAGLALLIVWLAWRYHATRATPWAAALAIASAGLVLLVEPGGPLMALCLLGGLAFLWLTDAAIRPAFGAAARGFPWAVALVAAAVAVAVIATLMLLYPSGLSAVGEVLGGFVAGLSARPAGQPFAHPLLALLVYEPLAWVFGVFGVVGALLAGNATGRFLAGWAIVAVVVGLAYPGATSAHTLMLILPLAALGAQVVAARLAPDARAQADAPPEPGNWDGLWEAPAWGMAAYTAGVVGMLAVVYVHLIHVGRELSASTAPPELATVLPYLLFAALSFALIVIGFFLVGATWGSGAAVRGLVLAAALVMGAYAVSAAWGLAVSRADDARELWYLERPSRAIHMLRATVQDGSERDRGAPNTAEVVAVIPPDGALAWALRDFRNLRFADAATPDIATPLVVLPAEIEEPSLGADYLGQSFVTRWTWRFDTLGTQGLLGWLLQRRTYVPPFASERYIVWLRTDIYGVPEATP